MTDDLVIKAKCEACQAAGIVALAIAPEYVLQLLSKIERLQSGLSAIEARWRAASRETIFRQHYRETMEQCADELRALLTGFDDREIQTEIDKVFDDEPLTRDQMPWFRENMRLTEDFQFKDWSDDSGMSDDPEELDDAEITKIIQQVEVTRKAIVGYCNKTNRPRGTTGCISCPICKTGEVLFSRSGYNGHIHAQCTTPNCVQWIE